jgi:hypothetical protein
MDVKETENRRLGTYGQGYFVNETGTIALHWRKSKKKGEIFIPPFLISSVFDDNLQCLVGTGGSVAFSSRVSSAAGMGGKGRSPIPFLIKKSSGLSRSKASRKT